MLPGLGPKLRFMKDQRGATDLFACSVLQDQISRSQSAAWIRRDLSPPAVQVLIEIREIQREQIFAVWDTILRLKRVDQFFYGCPGVANLKRRIRLRRWGIGRPQSLCEATRGSINWRVYDQWLRRRQRSVQRLVDQHSIQKSQMLSRVHAIRSEPGQLLMSAAKSLQRLRDFDVGNIRLCRRLSLLLDQLHRSRGMRLVGAKQNNLEALPPSHVRKLLDRLPRLDTGFWPEGAHEVATALLKDESRVLISGYGMIYGAIGNPLTQSCTAPDNHVCGDGPSIGFGKRGIDCRDVTNVGKTIAHEKNSAPLIQILKYLG